MVNIRSYIFGVICITNALKCPFLLKTTLQKIIDSSIDCFSCNEALLILTSTSITVENLSLQTTSISCENDALDLKLRKPLLLNMSSFTSSLGINSEDSVLLNKVLIINSNSQFGYSNIQVQEGFKRALVNISESQMMVCHIDIYNPVTTYLYHSKLGAQPFCISPTIKILSNSLFLLKNNLILGCQFTLGQFDSLQPFQEIIAQILILNNCKQSYLILQFQNLITNQIGKHVVIEIESLTLYCSAIHFEYNHIRVVHRNRNSTIQIIASKEIILLDQDKVYACVISLQSQEIFVDDGTLEFPTQGMWKCLNPQLYLTGTNLTLFTIPLRFCHLVVKCSNFTTSNFVTIPDSICDHSSIDINVSNELLVRRTFHGTPINILSCRIRLKIPKLNFPIILGTQENCVNSGLIIQVTKNIVLENIMISQCQVLLSAQGEIEISNILFKPHYQCLNPSLTIKGQSCYFNNVTITRFAFANSKGIILNCQNLNVYRLSICSNQKKRGILMVVKSLNLAWTFVQFSGNVINQLLEFSPHSNGTNASKTSNGINQQPKSKPLSIKHLSLRNNQLIIQEVLFTLEDERIPSYEKKQVRNVININQKSEFSSIVVFKNGFQGQVLNLFSVTENIKVDRIQIQGNLIQCANMNIFALVRASITVEHFWFSNDNIQPPVSIYQLLVSILPRENHFDYSDWIIGQFCHQLFKEFNDQYKTLVVSCELCHQVKLKNFQIELNDDIQITLLHTINNQITLKALITNIFFHRIRYANYFDQQFLQIEGFVDLLYVSHIVCHRLQLGKGSLFNLAQFSGEDIGSQLYHMRKIIISKCKTIANTQSILNPLLVIHNSQTKFIFLNEWYISGFYLTSNTTIPLTLEETGRCISRTKFFTFDFTASYKDEIHALIDIRCLKCKIKITSFVLKNNTVNIQLLYLVGRQLALNVLCLENTNFTSILFVTMLQSSINFIQITNGFMSTTSQPIFYFQNTRSLTLKSILLSFLDSDNNQTLIQIDGEYLQQILIRQFDIHNISSTICCGKVLRMENTSIYMYESGMQQVTNLSCITIVNCNLMLNNAHWVNITLDSNEKVNGVGLHAEQSSMILSNSIFLHNTGGHFGGSVYYIIPKDEYAKHLDLSGYVLIQNCSAFIAGGVYHLGPGVPSLKNGIKYLNNVDDTHSFSDYSSGPDRLLIIVREHFLNHNRLVFTTHIINSQTIYLSQIRKGSSISIDVGLVEGKVLHLEQILLKEGNISNQGFLNFSYVQPTPKSNKISLKIDETIKQNGLFRIVQLEFQFQFRRCVPGELNQQEICADCQSSTYSLVFDARTCSMCPSGCLCEGGKLIKILDGSWRNDFYSDSYIRCNLNPDACRELPAQKLHCISGYLGPMCQQCDCEMINTGVRYQRSSSNRCLKCTKDQSNYMTILLGIAIFLMLVGQLYLTYQSNRNFVIVRYIHKMGLLPMGVSGLFNDNMYIKSMLYHSSMLSLFFQHSSMSIIIQFTGWQGILQSSNTSIIQSIDCLYDPNLFLMELIYLEIFLKLLYIVMTLLILLLISTIVRIVSKLQSWNFLGKFITVYMYWIQLPQVIYKSIEASACEKIFDRLLVKSDLMQICLGANHKPFITYFLLPGCILFLISGLWGVKQLRNIHQSVGGFDRISFILVFGMFYNEFKRSYCYFELVQVFYRILIVITYEMVVQEIGYVGVIITIELLIYYLISIQLNVYLYHKTQKLEKQQTVTLILTMQIFMLCSLSNSVNVTILYQSLIVIINIILYAKCIKLIFAEIVVQQSAIRYFINRITNTQQVSSIKAKLGWKILKQAILLQNRDSECHPNFY